MPTEKKKVTRKLSAILSADVQGYSLLMADDEVHTIETLKAYRHKISELVSKHSGRVVDSPGDNVLAEFRSSVDAVECAVKIQKALDKENSKYVDDKKVQFRIGVNIGDVIQDGDRIYGNGVNVAARIEGLADPGGVCISRNVYNHVGNKLSLGYEYLGEHTVKNIKKPVRAYKLLMADEDAGKLIGDVPKSVAKKWIYATAVLAIIVITAVVWQAYQKMAEPEFEPAKVEEMAYPLPENPSIAVLAFDNMTGDPAQDYIGDGIAEAIITALSRIDELFVVARNSSFYFKGKSVKIKEISEELGVRYVMEGSVVSSGGKVRITAQLIDAVKGRHIWAKNYDHDFGNIIKIHDDISLNIAQNLRIELTEGEQERVFFDDYKNPEVFYKWAEANSQLRKGGEGSLERMGQLAQEVLDIEPESLIGYWMKGWYHKFLAENGISKKENVKKGFEYASKALSLNDNDSFTHSLMCGLYFIIRDYEKSIVSGKRAVELQPGADTAHMLLGKTLLYAEQYDEAIYHLKKSIRLNPFPAYFNFQYLGMCYYHKGQYKEALIELKKADKLSPDDSRILFYLAIVYSSLDREEEAQSSAKKALESGPYLSVSFVSKIWGYKTKDRLPKFLNAMRKAGFPEYPPGKEPPEKPSIAVLPFDNLSNDPEQGYFADGMTDELIADLAQIRDILVISRNSTFTYKGKAVKIQQVAQELNVRYVLEGSVQRYGNKVRIRAQLIDGKTDHHMWAESYDGVMDDIFELQDKITGEIVTALKVKLDTGGIGHSKKKETHDIRAYEYFIKGWNHYLLTTKNDFLKAIELYHKALEVDPNYNRVHAALALVYWEGVIQSSGDWLDSLDDHSGVVNKNIVMAQKYLNRSLKDPTSITYAVSSRLLLDKRKYKKAISQAQKGISSDHSNLSARFSLVDALIFSGQPEQALSQIEEILWLDPINPARAYIALSLAYYCMDNLQKAYEYIEKAKNHNPMIGCDIRAVIYANKGMKDEALTAAVACQPPFWDNIRWRMMSFQFNDKVLAQKVADGLYSAGVPGKASGYYKIFDEYKLNGDEIRDLLFDKKIQTHSYRGDKMFLSFLGNNVCTYTGPKPTEKGAYWIEKDSIWLDMPRLFYGENCQAEVYRYPDESEEVFGPYFLESSFNVFPFSILE